MEYCGYCGTIMDENGNCPADPTLDQFHEEDVDAEAKLAEDRAAWRIETGQNG